MILFSYDTTFIDLLSFLYDTHPFPFEMFANIKKKSYLCGAIEISR